MAGLGRGLGALLSASSKNRAEKSSSQAVAVLSEKAVKKLYKSPSPERKHGTAAVADSLEATDCDCDVNTAVIAQIPVNSLTASVYQPRSSFCEESLRELADSVRMFGLLEPLLVSQKKSDSGEKLYEIICGERRFRAAKIAGLKSVPCIVRELSPADSYAAALIENIQREDLNVLEVAAAYEQMMKECHFTQEELARTVGKSRSAVANTMRLLKLEPRTGELLRNGLIDMGHAKVLLALKGESQISAAETVAEKQMSVQSCNRLVKEILEGSDIKPGKSRCRLSLKGRFSSYEELINRSLRGVKARFVVKNENSGKLTLSYESADELESLLKALGVDQKSAENGN